LFCFFFLFNSWIKRHAICVWSHLTPISIEAFQAWLMITYSNKYYKFIVAAWSQLLVLVPCSHW
jgi:hypothetical protein